MDFADKRPPTSMGGVHRNNNSCIKYSKELDGKPCIKNGNCGYKADGSFECACNPQHPQLVVLKRD